VRLGVFVSNEGDFASRLGLARMAVAAEAAGGDGLWVSDHIVLLDEPTTEYPFSDDGVPTWDMTGDYYEALACCATMAAVTERCRIGTAVLVLPQRNVLEVAKTAATVDQLSGGRFALGVGAGWYSSEMQALGYTFESRGRRFDEMLDVLHECWTGRPAAYDGEEISVPDRVVMQPRPAQQPGIPLLVGGMSAPARRRAAKRGEGWLALAVAESWDPELLARQLDDVRARRVRDGEFEAVLQLNSDPDDGERMIELVIAAGAIGFDEVIVEPPWARGIEAACALITDVKDAVGAQS
jgi:probable F420-dependent oxidoreductase